MPTSRGLQYLRKNFDSAAILSALSAVALTDDAAALEERDYAVLAALRRSNTVLENAPLPEVQGYLRGLDEDQIPGLVSNCRVPDDWLLKNRLPLLHGREALRTLIEEWKAHRSPS